MKKILILIILFAVGSFAQSLDSLIAEGLNNNPYLKAFQERRKASEFKSRGAINLPPPTLGIEFSQVPINSFDLLNQPISQNISLSQMFMVGGKLSSMQKVEEKNTELITNDYVSSRNNLIKQIATTYNNIWMMEHHIEINETNADLLNQFMEAAQQMFEINKVPLSEILTIRNEISVIKTELIEMENELKSELIMMNALLGRDLNEDKVDVQHQFNVDTSDLAFENLQDTLLRFNPDINRMDLMVQMNQLDITANSKELIPDIIVQGMLMRMPKGMIVTTQTPMDMLGMGETEYMYSIMASVTLPFMPWSSSRINNREEELLSSIKGIQLEKENMTRDMSATLMMQINKINTLRAKINSLQNNVIPELKNIIEVQRTEFLSGKISIRNIIESLRMLLMQEEELAEYQAQHQSAMYELQSITGFSQFNNEKGNF